MELSTWQSVVALIVATMGGGGGLLAAIKLAANLYRAHVKRVASELERDRTARLAEEAVTAKNAELEVCNEESSAWQSKHEDARVTIAELRAELHILKRALRQEGR